MITTATSGVSFSSGAKPLTSSLLGPSLTSSLLTPSLTHPSLTSTASAVSGAFSTLAVTLTSSVGISGTTTTYSLVSAFPHRPSSSFSSRRDLSKYRPLSLASATSSSAPALSLLMSSPPSTGTASTSTASTPATASTRLPLAVKKSGKPSPTAHIDSPALYTIGVPLWEGGPRIISAGPEINRIGGKLEKDRTFEEKQKLKAFSEKLPQELLVKMICGQVAFLSIKDETTAIETITTAVERLPLEESSEGKGEAS